VNIHPTALVSKNALLEDKVIIGPYSIIHDEVLIKKGTVIGSSVEIFKNSEIGSNCQIHKGAVIGEDPQHLSDPGVDTKVIIGDNNIIREFVTIHRGTEQGNGKTVIGDNNFIMVAVHVAHDCVLGNNIIIANETGISGHTVIEDYANISGICPIHQFIRIGGYCFVGGGYRVNKDIWPYALAAGDPIGITGLNIVGLRRVGFDKKVIRELRKAFKILFQSNIVKLDDRLDEIEKTCEDLLPIKHLLNFGRSETKMGLAGRFRR
jgi:UDP-N-acetylglucosamine acyltransferase